MAHGRAKVHRSRIKTLALDCCSTFLLRAIVFYFFIMFIYIIYMYTVRLRRRGRGPYSMCSCAGGFTSAAYLPSLASFLLSSSRTNSLVRWRSPSLFFFFFVCSIVPSLTSFHHHLLIVPFKLLDSRLRLLHYCTQPDA